MKRQNFTKYGNCNYFMIYTKIISSKDYSKISNISLTIATNKNLKNSGVIHAIYFVGNFCNFVKYMKCFLFNFNFFMRKLNILFIKMTRVMNVFFLVYFRVSFIFQ